MTWLFFPPAPVVRHTHKPWLSRFSGEITCSALKCYIFMIQQECWEKINIFIHLLIEDEYYGHNEIPLRRCRKVYPSRFFHYVCGVHTEKQVLSGDDCWMHVSDKSLFPQNEDYLHDNPRSLKKSTSSFLFGITFSKDIFLILVLFLEIVPIPISYQLFLLDNLLSPRTISIN